MSSESSQPTAANPLVVAIIGAGPSGIYAAEALSQQVDVPVRVAVIDRLPVPFGLVRYGVAPDHHSIRSIRNTLERTLEKSDVRFFGNVTIGADISVDELRNAVDAVIYAYGAGSDKRLEISGEHLPGSIAAPEFVAWYCGHPDVHPDLDTVVGDDDDHLTAAGIDELLATSTSAVVVGVGNVALDVARVLIKSADQLDDTDMADEVLESLGHKQITDVHVLGRRGPAYTSFTTKELRELGQLPGVDVIVDAGDLELDDSSRAVVERNKIAARNLAVLNEWAGRTPTGAAGRIHFHFWTRPIKIIGTDRVAAVEVERTMINSDGYVVGAGPTQHHHGPIDHPLGRLSGGGVVRRAVRREHRSGAARRRPGDPGRGLLGRRVRHRLDQARSDRSDRHQQIRCGRDRHLAAGRCARRCRPGSRAQRRP